ncbi:GSCFA domain-containing protein [Pseudooceanicola sp. HF7]|uniref:GSCFA domain-containing protein n=1 Tax=Pseudooceanicola sp. HF7 TaxID=2721560 RepID=UPI0014308A4E|nr:GSCFA domain-containing protein [Pseudooceanicola sp. HF7]NIZ09007.1 GSCFA domain-containing protein [Pseudooceanicola sp. HF7]
MNQIAGPEAFSGALRNKSRKYPDRADARYQEGMIFPEVTPGFHLSPGESVFTIGSCFARNVEKALLSRGLSVPTAHFSAPQEEAPGQPNRILNQYNPGTMLQCVTQLDRPVDEAGLYPVAGGQVLDCLLATGSRPVSPDRARERRQQIRDLYAEGLAASDVVVITLGLVETWYDRETATFLNEAPSRKLLSANPGRFLFRQLDMAESQALIFEMIERLIENGRRKVLITVSPVPIQVTFAGGDAVARNAYSKSVLRVVAELALQSFPDVDYFPSYEIVTTLGLNAYGEDNVHVRPAIVDRVIGYMTSRYLA